MEALVAVVAAAPKPAVAIPIHIPLVSALPQASPSPFALLPAQTATALAFADAARESSIRPEEAVAAPFAASRALRIVSDDPAVNDEGLAQVVVEQVQPELVDPDEIHILMDPLPNENPN